MYDLVETQQQILERSVLRQTFNWDTALCNPQRFTKDAPVLDCSTMGKIPGEEDKESLCSTDFKNACFTANQNFSGILKTTWMPMFMACELLYGKGSYEMLCQYHIPPVTLDQFVLEGNVLELYMKICGQRRYDSYNNWLQSVLSGVVKEVHPFATGDFTISNQPHHDMESVYWIILWFLVTSWPNEVALEDLNLSISGRNSHHFIIRSMLARGTDMDTYPIVNFLANSKEIWELKLHPIYQLLAGMVADMGQYIAMRWSRFPDAPFWHSHEAFKRLLLKEIFRMTKDHNSVPIRGSIPPLTEEKPFC
ncbi:hypothetical protein Clacol_003214 [Clathrus columnatus]|uniref:Fungal-type protein kinase domain-containing protein n=1 Tax=Clathrus columnatus TaxID=1419009 RepID=A0AAV5A6Z9_9AGAM|nr:hypothetical protein Clacol_003214 [Clathrus columnatus]